jgi:hypothetical protein
MPAALLDGVGPSLYQSNGFRLVGLPVNASARDLRRRSEELSALARLGGTPPPRPGALLPVQPPPALDAVQDAIEELRSPERRLVQELFWFWPAPAGDEGTALLLQGDFAGAAAAWRTASAGAATSLDGAVALHNLAVLYHVRALDNQRPKVWHAALQAWKAVFDNDLCWHWLADRVRQLDDPRLTPQSANELRVALPGALLSINAAIATQRIDAGSDKQALEQLGHIQRSGFPAAEIELARNAIAEPLVETVRRECRRVVDAVEADREVAARVGGELLQRSERPLAVLDTLLPEEHPLRDGAHDEVALTVLTLTLVGHGKSIDDRAAQTLLERAADVAATEPAVDRIEENLDVLESNVMWSTCWYCGKQAVNGDDANTVAMWGDVSRRPTYGGTEMTWKTGSVKVPRCPECRSGTARMTGARTLLKWAVGLLFALALLLLCFSASHWKAALVPAALALVPIVLLGVTGGSAGAELRRTREFPAVAEQLRQGWIIGPGPQGQQRR